MVTVLEEARTLLSAGRPSWSCLSKHQRSAWSCGVRCTGRQALVSKKERRLPLSTSWWQNEARRCWDRAQKTPPLLAP